MEDKDSGGALASCRARLNCRRRRAGDDVAAAAVAEEAAAFASPAAHSWADLAIGLKKLQPRKPKTVSKYFRLRVFEHFFLFLQKF